MKWTNGYIFTLKDAPADAEIPSHQLLTRAGYIRKVGQGVYTYGPLLLRSMRKFETIIREEHDRANCVELLMPMCHPRELWDETGRWDKMGKGLLKFKNRLDQDWCLGATHEEVITDFVRKDVKSYRDLPKILYQIQTKYRDEIRPRFGLMRGREFVMKDAYSFDTTAEKALGSYQTMYDVYVNIFRRLGAEFRVVSADSGDIGGDKSQEFHILADSGEDQLMVSEQGDFAANIEICPAIYDETEKAKPALSALEKFATPGLKTIKDLAAALKTSENSLVKTMFYNQSDGNEFKPVAVLLRGDDQVNPIKLKKILKLNQEPLMLTDQEVKKVTGAMPGSCGPVGLNIPVYIDNGVSTLFNYTVGANQDDFHYKGVNHGRDYKVTEVVDVRLAKPGDKNPQGPGRIKSVRGIEVGHIFYLGTTYSKKMNANYLDNNGKSQVIEMGCYGIGVSRTLQAVIEQNHDQDGIIWPVPLAPYVVHICLLDPKDPKAKEVTGKIYQELNDKKIDVLVDDRDERPGSKFKDADLLGMPLRLTIGARGLANNEIETYNRRTKEKGNVSTEKIVEHVVNFVQANLKSTDKKH